MIRVIKIVLQGNNLSQSRTLSTLCGKVPNKNYATSGRSPGLGERLKKPPGSKSIATSSTFLERSNYSPSYYCNMNSSHLEKGSSCPPLQQNKLRIYSMRFCPYAQRAILVALAKGIPHDVVNCNLKEKPEWLIERNLFGKVPVVEFSNGDIIFESLIVADYFNEVYETRPLHSPDPLQRAMDRMWITRFNKAISTFYKVIFAIRAEDYGALEEHLQKFQFAIKSFDTELVNRRTTFFGGEDLPGMLDYMIWPWFERMPAFTTFIPKAYSKTLENFSRDIPAIERWQAQMKEDFPVKEFLLPTEAHQEFIRSFISGSPNYNSLVARL